MARGEISELTTLIYEARENAIAKIAQDANAAGADDVVGIKTNVYQLGGGIIEFLAIGTAVKRMPGLATASPDLPTQSIIDDKDTFINLAESELGRMGDPKRRGAKKPEKAGWGAVLEVVLKLLGG